MTPLDNILASMKQAGLLEGTVEWDGIKVHAVFDRQGPAQLDERMGDAPARAVRRPAFIGAPPVKAD